MDKLFYVVPALGIVGLLYTFIKFAWVAKQDAGNERMREISTYIAEGAMAFLKAEYKILGYFVIIGALLLAVMGYSNANSHWSIALAFVLGAFFSALAGFIGMKVATKANVRTAQAARTSLSKALSVSCRSENKSYLTRIMTSENIGSIQRRIIRNKCSVSG